MSDINKVRTELRRAASKKKARVLQRYFKTGPGEYGEGDLFIGIVVPTLRLIALRYTDLSMREIQSLLNSRIHEERTVALFMLVRRFEKADEAQRKIIYNFYLKNRSRVNNWDLVDLSADRIVGGYLYNRSKHPIYKLTRSTSLWDRRIAVLATFHFIKRKEFEHSFKIITSLLKDEEDLMHKACGWMLREIGKRDEKALESYLKKHCRVMPRTMLRYSIERLSEQKRKRYMKRS